MADSLIDISVPFIICKSLEEGFDNDGNYIFETEASNENLDLQNQITQQTALLDSKEYFLSNGVVSDDHQHKKRRPDGTIETDKSKIIGEPISVRTEGKRTFVKGKLYGAVEAAKPFITLLKAHSSRVKASIGGIMPRIVKNPDGTETITSFLWNDMALTVSPVNYTVGSACFAKSLTNAEFCKALTAESPAGMALQHEDLEPHITQAQLAKDSEIEKNNDKNEALIRNCLTEIKNKKLQSNETEITNYLIFHGMNKHTAQAAACEIIKQGGPIMAKSWFRQQLDEIFQKSLPDNEKPKKDDEAVNENDLDLDGINDNEDGNDNDDVDKSIVDMTSILKSVDAEMTTMRQTIEDQKAQIAELQGAVLDVTKSFSSYLEKPNARQTVIQKSATNTQQAKKAAKPDTTDFDVLKSALMKASHEGKIGVETVQLYSSEFQKAMKGETVNPKVMQDICRFVNANK